VIPAERIPFVGAPDLGFCFPAPPGWYRYDRFQDFIRLASDIHWGWIEVAWSVQLGGKRLTCSDASPPDRDYSGGSTFSSRERRIALGDDRRFHWRDSSFTRVSVPGMYLPPNQQQTDITGTWDIELGGQTPLLVLRPTTGDASPSASERPGGARCSWTARPTP
jgi:hypothetical protein